MKGYMYILKCANGCYYTGSTTNLEKRLEQHKNGEGANFTKKHLPVELVYAEEFARIEDAFYREKQIQGWSRKKKEALIAGNFNKLHELAECKNDTKSLASTPLSNHTSTPLSNHTSTPLSNRASTTPATMLRSVSVAEPGSVSVAEPYELPADWKWCRMPDVVTWGSGGTPKATEPKYYEGGTIPWLIIADLNDSVVNDSISKITPLGLANSSAKMIPKNTLLVAMYGSIGKLGITGIECCTNQAIAFAKELRNTTTKYMYYYMSSIKSKLIAMGRGGTQQNISQTLLNTLSIPLPPTLAEQQRIVLRIESLFAKLDQAKEKAQTVLDSFEKRKAAILHKAFTGELTAKWRKENDSRNNTELDSIYSFVQSLSKKDITNIEEFHKKASDYILSDGTLWKKCCIGAIGIVTNGSTPSRKNPAFWNGDIPWVSSGEVSNNIIEATNECITEEGYNNSSVKKLPIGTVLIAMIGDGKTRGQTSILNIEATTNQNIAAIIINHGHVEPKFLWYWLQKEYKNNRTAGNGSGPQALNCQRVRELPFILPTLPEQQEIVRILDSVLEKESHAKEAAQSVLDQISLLKKSILARAFRGKL